MEPLSLFSSSHKPISPKNEVNDDELVRLLISERRPELAQEDIELLERSQQLKVEYQSLENVNPSVLGEPDQNIYENENDIEFCLAENNLPQASADDYNFIQEADYFLEDVSSRTGLIQPCDVNNLLISYISDDGTRQTILDLNKQIESNIAKCRIITNEAKVVLAEKLDLKRSLNEIEERIMNYSVEDTKFRKIQKRKGTDCALTKTNHRTYFCRFGIPYFKSKERFPTDQNDDLKEIITRNEVMMVRIPTIRRFLPHDAKLMDRNILQQLKTKRIQQLQQRLKNLIPLEKGNDDYEQQKHNLMVALLEANKLKNVLGVTDWNIPVDFLALTKSNWRFTAEDYERIWHLLGNPKLDRRDFSKEELNRLRELVKEHGAQDWDRIAEKLNTNRSGFMCFSKYVGISKKGTFVPWTEEEDNLLLKLCTQLSHIKDSVKSYHWWRNIRRQFPQRTYTQIHGHWSYVLQPSLKKGRFDDEETAKLEKLIVEDRSFKEISSIFRNRSSVQLRSHYKQLKQRGANAGLWTEEEENQLADLVQKYGTKNWVKISEQLGTRSRSQCRLKYYLYGKNGQGQWKPDESEKFDKLMQKYGQDFVKISAELGTKTVAQCQMKHKRRLMVQEPVRREGRWTRREKKNFSMLLEKYGRQFEVISRELGSRDAEQCEKHYNKLHRIDGAAHKTAPAKRDPKPNRVSPTTDLVPTTPSIQSTAKQCRWSKRETRRFKELLDLHGCAFSQISEALKTKTILQCQRKYDRILRADSMVCPEEKNTDSSLLGTVPSKGSEVSAPEESTISAIQSVQHRRRWTKSEKAKLASLVAQYKSDFLKISKQLQTKTALQCSKMYSKMVREGTVPTVKSNEEVRKPITNQWSEEECERFEILLQKYNCQFSKVSKELGTKNFQQCRKRYEQLQLHGCVSNDLSEKDPLASVEELKSVSIKYSDWTNEEDTRFGELVEKYGCQFSKISHDLGTKNAQQCRKRYEKIIAPTQFDSETDCQPTKNYKEVEQSIQRKCTDKVAEIPEKSGSVVKKAKTNKRKLCLESSSSKGLRKENEEDSTIINSVKRCMVKKVATTDSNLHQENRVTANKSKSSGRTPRQCRSIYRKQVISTM